MASCQIGWPWFMAEFLGGRWSTRSVMHRACKWEVWVQRLNSICYFDDDVNREFGGKWFCPSEVAALESVETAAPTDNSASISFSPFPRAVSHLPTFILQILTVLCGKIKLSRYSVSLQTKELDSQFHLSFLSFQILSQWRPILNPNTRNPLLTQ